VAQDSSENTVADQADGSVEPAPDGDQERIRAALTRFGVALRALRQSHEWTQAQAATAVGISQAQWCKIERAQADPGLAVALEVVRVFELDSLDRLFGPGAVATLLGVART
jgi:DNA-binding XRE family transcriptional regulator